VFLLLMMVGKERAREDGVEEGGHPQW